MTFSRALDRLRERDTLPLFAVRVWDEALDDALRAATAESLFPGRTLADAGMAVAALAGLHLWNDNFDAAHGLCQALETPTGSYLHGLCHRREGHRGEGLAANLANSRYWFRRSAGHPVYPIVHRAVLGVLEQAGAGTGFRWATEAEAQLRAAGAWDPAVVSDWVAQADSGSISAASTALVEEIQWRELALLVDWCEARALGE
jgi:hypothetical protein